VRSTFQTVSLERLSEKWLEGVWSPRVGGAQQRSVACFLLL
jgi:hypothetical protein